MPIETVKRNVRTSLKELVDMASQNDVELIRDALGIKDTDEELVDKALRETRNLDTKKQRLIQVIDGEPRDPGDNGDLVVAKISRGYKFFVFSEKKWNEVSSFSESSILALINGLSNNGLRGGGDQNAPSIDRYHNPLDFVDQDTLKYDSGWFAVSNNTTYVSGTSSGFNSIDLSRKPTISFVNIFFATSSPGTTDPVYPVNTIDTDNGVYLKYTPTSITLRTGANHVTTYWNGTITVNATSGYLKVIVL